MKEIIKDIRGYKLCKIEFSSMEDFLDFIKSAPKITQQNESVEGSYSFTKTHTLDEAIRLCEEGYFDKTFSIFKNVVLRAISTMVAVRKPFSVKNDILGFAPNVPYYLQGHPLNMYNDEYEKKLRPTKKINIFYNSSMPWYMLPATIVKKGLIFLSIFELLKKLNYDVELKFTSLSEGNSKNYGLQIDVDIQRQGGYNINELYFPLVHPSFLRRLIFACKERCQFLKDKQEFFDGYGNTVNLRKFIDMDEDSINIVSSDYDDVYKRKDIYELFKYVIADLKKQGVLDEDAYNQIITNLEEIKDELLEFQKELRTDIY